MKVHAETGEQMTCSAGDDSASDNIMLNSWSTIQRDVKVSPLKLALFGCSDRE